MRYSLYIINIISNQQLYEFNIRKSFKSGTLEDEIEMKRMTRSPLSIEDIRLWSTQLLKGLEFLHEKNLIHRDIKPAYEIFI
jgi:serine/threonine protein kinase